MENQSSFLGYVHSFRGFAILNIVAIHAMVAPFFLFHGYNLDFKDPLIMVNEILLHDSTIYFALISGLLYSAILRKRGLKKFYRSKVLNVFLPYLFFTLLFSFFPFEENTAPLTPISYFQSVARNLIFGTAQVTYWYLPLLFYLFALTPLLDYLIYSPKTKKLAAVFFLAIPLVFSRNQIFLSPGTLIFFTGCYAGGILLGKNLEANLQFLNSQRRLLWLLTLLSTGLLILFYQLDINYLGFTSLLESSYYIQKMAFSGIMLLWYKKMKAAQPRGLSGFARDSFAIYFLHLFFVFGIAFSIKPLIDNQSIYPINILGSALICFLGSLLLSRLIIRLARLLLGKKSRMLVGS